LNIHDDILAPNLANLEATIASPNERLAQMQKNAEDLTVQNAVLQATRNPEVHARHPEQSHTPIIVPPHFKSREQRRA